MHGRGAQMSVWNAPRTVQRPAHAPRPHSEYARRRDDGYGAHGQHSILWHVSEPGEPCGGGGHCGGAGSPDAHAMCAGSSRNMAESVNQSDNRRQAGAHKRQFPDVRMGRPDLRPIRGAGLRSSIRQHWVTPHTRCISLFKINQKEGIQDGRVFSAGRICGRI